MHLLYEIEHLSTHGGIERILTDKANYIAEKWGWKVTIVVLLQEEHITAYSVSPKVNIVYLDIRLKGLLMCLEALWKLNNIVRKLNPDIYLTFQTIGAMSCLFRTHRVKTVYEAHGIRTYMQHPLAMSMAEKFADCVVTLTDKNAQRYSKAKRLEVIPNFTNIKPEGIPDYSRKHCVTLGRLDFEKNYSRLIEIWSKVHCKNKEWILDIYGEGPEKEKLQQQIEELGLSESIILHGLTKDPIGAYYSASIYLMTSRFEGFPMVLIESQCCGLPCVSFDCDDGPRAIINNGKTGYLIPYDDNSIFIEKLLFLMDDEKLRHNMGQAAKLSSQYYQASYIMNMWQRLFTSL